MSKGTVAGVVGAAILGAGGVLLGVGDEATTAATKIEQPWARPPIKPVCRKLVGRYRPDPAGLSAPSLAGVPHYAVVVTCAEEPAAPLPGEPAKPLPIPLPVEFTPIEEEAAAYDPEAPQMVAKNPDEAPAFACACAGKALCEACLVTEPGKTCVWKAAPKGVTFGPGQFRGACVPKPCVEINWARGEFSSMPAECK